MVRGPAVADLRPSRGAYLGHEPACPVRVDGIPGAPVYLEIRAHDRPVRDGEEISDVGRLDTGVREDRRFLPTSPLGLADRVHRRLGAGHRTGDEDGVGKTGNPYGAGGCCDVAR